MSSRSPGGGFRRRAPLAAALALALAVPGSLAPVAVAADLPGAPKIAKPKDAKVRAVNAQGAKAARERVAKNQAENKVQADRARTEAKAEWPKAADLTAATSAKRANNRPLVDVRPTAVPKSSLLSPGVTAGPFAAPPQAPDGTGGKPAVKVLDQKASKQAGITGVLFTASSRTAGPAQVTVDYGSFASAVGGGWSTRLGLVSLPSCVLTTPEKTECRKTTPLPSANSIQNRTVTADVASLPAGNKANAPAVFAVMATETTSPKGTGDFAATPLSASSAWESGSSAGAFTWSYPVTIPPAAAGPSPALSFSYSSGSIDGRTANTNNQGSQIGEGFDLTSSFVERKYGSCDDDGQKDKFDLCWKYDNASLVLNGKSSELVKDDTSGTWRLKDDDASQVTWGTDAQNDDANGEFWKVVTGDGTTYTFGLNKLPGAGDQRTNSTWTVPVFGDDSGEPGYTKGSTFASRAEIQAWRWNLDLVQDVHGNAASYWYAAETNNYAKNRDTTTLAPYTRGGTLSEIRYGQRADTLFTANPSHKIIFGYDERCFAASCKDLTETSSDNWPDVPFDAICAKGATDCRALAPAFFTRKRMTTLTTHAWSTALEPDNYTPIDTYDLAQQYLDPGDLGDTSDQTLVLKSLKRTGLTGTKVEVPPVDFTYHMRPNRVDADGDDVVPLNRPRINTVTSETGAITTVTLSTAQCVRGTKMPVAEDDNALSCHPVYWAVNGGDPKLDWFHKYNVIAVTTADPAGQNDLVENAYEYENPGWHYNDDPLTPEKQRTWSSWRGYGKVTAYTGAVGKTRSKTVKVFMQGMHGDKRKGTSTTRTAVTTAVPVPGLDIPHLNDDDQYSGFQRQEITYDGATALAVSVTDPWSKETASQQKSYASIKARYVRPQTGYSHVLLTASNTWRTTKTDTTYDDYGMATRTASSGDTAKTGDETCTRTWYARNDAKGITALTSRTRTVGALCSVTDDKLTLPTTLTTRGDVLTDTATVYDDTTATAWTANQTPTLGLPTWNGRAQSYPAANGTADRDPAGSAGWQTLSKATYDTAAAKLGRPLSTTDTNGNTTTTSYAPAAAGPLEVTVTTAPKLASNGQQHRGYVYTNLRGSVVRAIDANMASTYSTYDALGRITATWLPNRGQSMTPNVKYDYLLARGKQPWTSTSTLGADGEYKTVYTIADSLLRPLQTQAPSPSGGRILTDTRYDSRGLAYETYADIWDKDKTPEGTYARAEYGSTPAQTQSVFDGLGRATTNTLLVYGVEKWSTATSYTGDSVATTAPQGGTASRAINDAMGRTTETRTYGGTTPNDPAYGGTAPGTPFTSVSHTYTRDGKPATTTGPDNAKWSYVYDLFGRTVSTTDPDAGKSTTTYTALDQIATAKDARNTVLEYAYDELGRKTSLWKSPKSDANKLAAWTYDTVLKGALADSTRYEGGLTGKAYTKSVTAYDSLGRPTISRLTLPSDDPLVTSGAIAATTDHSVNYRLDGTLNTTSTPAVAGLPSEILQLHYTSFGLPKALTGTTDYVQDVAYSPLSEVEQLTLARSTAAGVRKTFIGNTYEEGTRRLLRSTANDQTHTGMLQELSYKYDQAGNVLSILDSAPLSGFTKADNQCFTYDGQRRLTEAWTPKTADCATSGRTVAKLGGAAPYWNSYTYTASGQRATEKTNSATPQTRTYCYDPARPHALAATTIGTTCTGVAPQYTYDATGNTTKRAETPGSATSQTLAWNAEGNLGKVTEGTTATDYIYDAEGQLLIRRDAAGETILYAGVTEVHLKGAKKWATRSYGIAGSKVAVLTSESGTPKMSFTAGDSHGTSSLTVSADDTQTVSKRYTTPFGAARGPAPASWPEDKRFLDKPEDTNTTLTHIGAREYDAALGQFISVDPILSLDQHQSLNGYNYANNNPVTQSDPTGERSEECGTIYDCGPKGTMTLGNTGDITTRTDDGSKIASTHHTQGNGQGGTRGNKNPAPPTVKSPGNDVYVLPKVNRQEFLDIYNTYYQEKLSWFGPSGDPAQEWATRLSALIYACQKMVDRGCDPATFIYANLKSTIETVGIFEGGGIARPTVGIFGGAKPQPGGCKCFLAGTDVLMADGTTKDIEDIELGEEVKATDPETGETSNRQVTRLIVTEDDKHFNTLSIATKDGIEQLTATHEHPFWSPSSGAWLAARDLRPGATLLTDGGATVVVTANQSYTQYARTYNLTVDDVHTYYVLAGSVPVLVHNSNCGQVEYGSTELSRATAFQRLAENNRGNNYGAARLDDGTILVGRSSAGVHAEEDLIRQAGDRRIVDLYSERQPCAAKCEGLTAGMNTSWSWQWNGVDRGAVNVRIKATINNLFK
ncbi:polymorphic toxin-type HINT domain-containing protein [Streptomyces sp. NPDC058613]|uniref:polymorphic toxin-type HINT domain-containing protein n=1 Tax=unclassified Streptomyces TaxID=2593676 RepID=UPI00365CEB22